MRAAGVLLAALVLAGCGGGDRRPPAREAVPGTAVVRRWADAVREGRFAAAARTFAVPATVANGGRPLTLRSRAEVDFFNRTLPCGAILTSTRRATGGRLVATFRLTTRRGPGADCGSGVGHEAQVAFRIRGGRIAEWLRIATPGGGSAPTLT